jgi:hypothetical protein
MKKYFLLLVLLVSTMTFIACNQKKENGNDDKMGPATDRMVSLTRTDEALNIDNLDSLQESFSIDTTTYNISVKKAKQMVAKYLGSIRYINHRRNSSEDYRPDTRYVWYDSLFMEYLYKTFKAEKASGIRIYFGVYDEPTDAHQLYKTAIITTTERIINGRDILHRDILSEAYFQNPSKSAYWKKMFYDPMNHGGLCPPPNSCYGQGALLLPSSY